ncbi:hypothetical protein ACI3B4_000059 [Enterobacter hormaechei]
MKNVSAVEKMAEIMQQMEESSPRVAAIQYCLKHVAEEAEKRNAELEARCAALAAENGQMLRLLTDISENHDEYVNQDEYLYAGVPMDYVSEINAYVSRDVEAENPFKETDAFLAEVRAQGVEMFSNKFGGGTLISDMVKETAKDFAAHLRKGVQS